MQRTDQAHSDHTHSLTAGAHSHQITIEGAHTHSITGHGYSHAITPEGNHAHGITQAEAPATDPNTHTLDTPIVRGNQTIDKITLRKPRSGELRGVSLSDLVSLDVSALSKVLPRISTPTLTEHDVANIDPADLVQLGGIFAGFLMPKAMKASMASQTA